MKVLQMFWRLGPSGLNQLESSKLVQQLHYAAPVSSSSLFHIDTSPPPNSLFHSPFGPFSFTLLISSFTLLAQVVIESEVSQQTNAQKKVIEYVDQWQNPKILQSDLATMAINHLLCSVLSLFIVISHSPLPPHPLPLLQLPFRHLAPGETVGRPCCCICLWSFCPSPYNCTNVMARVCVCVCVCISLFFICCPCCNTNLLPTDHPPHTLPTHTYIHICSPAVSLLAGVYGWSQH